MSILNETVADAVLKEAERRGDPSYIGELLLMKDDERLPLLQAMIDEKRDTVAATLAAADANHIQAKAKLSEAVTTLTTDVTEKG